MMCIIHNNHANDIADYANIKINKKKNANQMKSHCFKYFVDSYDDDGKSRLE